MTGKAVCVRGLVIAVLAGGAAAARADVIVLRQGLDGYVGARDTSIMSESGALTAGATTSSSSGERRADWVR